MPKAHAPNQTYCSVSILSTPVSPWKPSLLQSRLDSPLSLSALNQNNHVYPVPLISPVVPWFPECDLGISSTHETWPALCSGVAYILLSRVTLALRLHQAKHPVPRLVTHIPEFSLFDFLWFFHPKEGGFIQDPSGRATQDQTWTTWRHDEECCHWEPSFPSDSLSPCFSPGHLSFPWPLPSRQTL